jgi:AraC-like DNA-binding protein
MADGTCDGTGAPRGAQIGVEFAERTRRIISEQLALGRTTRHDVARTLALGERTLRRRLSAIGTCYQELLDEVRFEQTLDYLRNSSCSAVKLASRLGFSGPPAFYRAFRRWTGSSLREYRRSVLRASAGARANVIATRLLSEGLQMRSNATHDIHHSPNP